MIWEHIGYRPTPLQLKAHQHPARLKLVAGGERAGKSFSAAMELLARCDVADGLFWIVGPTYDLARPEFNYITEVLGKLGAIRGRASWPARGACSLRTKWNATIATRSADDPVKLAGQAPDGVLMCEAAQQGYEVWLRLRGRVAEKRGWLWASGTFEGSLGWYPEVWRRWQSDNVDEGASFSLPSWSNERLYPGGRNDPEILALEATYPADVFQERFGAVPCPPAGLVYKEFSELDHVSFDAEYRAGVDVHMAVDPGYAGAYAVLALQEDGPFVHVIDEVYATGRTAFDMIAESKARPWWQDVRYGVIDIAGRQHQGLPSHVEIWQQEAGVYLQSNTVSIVDGIQRLHTFLRDPASDKPLILFHPRCKSTAWEFGQYRYPKVSENRPEREEPIDRDNHAIKALSYWLFARFGPVNRVQPRSIPGHDPFASIQQPSGPRVDMVRTADGTVRFGREQKQQNGNPLRFR